MSSPRSSNERRNGVSTASFSVSVSTGSLVFGVFRFSVVLPFALSLGFVVLRLTRRAGWPPRLNSSCETPGSSPA